MQADWQQQIDQVIQDKSLRRAYSWTPLARGSSNLIFLGHLRQRYLMPDSQNHLVETVVLRLNAQAKDTPGVDRQREADILNLITSYGWAPQIIRNEPEQGWCLMHHYTPATLEQKSVGRLPPHHEKQLLNAVNQLQAIPCSSEDLQTDYQALLNETYLPIAVQRQNTLAHTWIQSIKHKLAALPKIPTCLVHHDIHVGNLLLSILPEPAETALILLDWEYAAFGNPWFDASCLSRYLLIPADDIHALDIFNRLDKATFKTALAQANSMTDTLEKLWGWARE